MGSINMAQEGLINFFDQNLIFSQWGGDILVCKPKHIINRSQLMIATPHIISGHVSEFEYYLYRSNYVVCIDWLEYGNQNTSI